MSDIKWLPREFGVKDHHLWGEDIFSKEAPGVIFEKKPIIDPQGNAVEGLYSAWVTLNNPNQYNSYTTEMVKAVIAGFHRASADTSVVACVFTAVGDRAFCTGGNTKEYAEYYARRPNEYGIYMDLFNAMVDAILTCKKPTICRVNGMRVGGGQEIGMATDLTVSSDLAIFGQAGARHGSAPDGGSTDFLPWMLPMEQAMWNSVSCELWSAYKMSRLGLITKCVPVLKENGEWICNPLVITDKYLDGGQLVYGEFKAGDEAKAAKDKIKSMSADFERLDKEIDNILWTFTNLFPGCVIKTIEGIRLKKKFYWDQAKVINRHWLAANMNGEAFLGFNAFNTKKLTGRDTIDFIEFRRRQVNGDAFDDEFMAAVLAKPKK
ncbi:MULTISPECIES: 6-oxocyclohex-1-ene-1-carbonyl-CoA hydratase [Desulfococcus]|uniref:6-oxocyclohex-1-ene-1-carbonyl-CoA hydratase n=2 Tax=Desulfococcus multivorans TaxID=897 RepID=S7U671_DESML|nr:6-oxocyclohex-1-ene-1-carbonyl-CoA hydratase [Desulfococcus multivorans]AOY59266.1 Oah: predicted 6-oxo-cyclohex-1-ene-carbonyl- CoA hydrolase [Desulfococcus multivorans]AQV01488.1 6-oxocyclohex-1-ene-1-carbonyl-CoA hydratase [Desulfococcus multivorans]EPR45026.1 6-oxocyclohex-1-ene-1-carbonyl-CoA hydrolase [Desulfococcus multivorans DSM 2059]MDX9817963.1 6-oxocyclohex-1-ene-1-carbonyl-CoA hydratase [Desulfococcus multivorans]SKA26797.1 6-ketocyclohex-1-ene-1-carbonyl-CoA hydrolase [Desulfo